MGGSQCGALAAFWFLRLILCARKHIMHHKLAL